jgi:avidin family protein
VSVTGVWINQRGSIVALREEPSGQIMGKYRSVVGRDLQARDLAGRVSQPDGNKQMLGFTVCFRTDNPLPQFGRDSICTWSGWVREKKIMTRWLLTRSMSHPEDEWSSTVVGNDEFDKISDMYDEKHLAAST